MNTAVVEDILIIVRPIVSPLYRGLIIATKGTKSTKGKKIFLFNVFLAPARRGVLCGNNIGTQ
jgi:hypothetical protein